jgi:hypothetical protein
MTSVAEPGREAGNDTAAGVSGLSAAALASWGNACGCRAGLEPPTCWVRSSTPGDSSGGYRLAIWLWSAVSGRSARRRIRKAAPHRAVDHRRLPQRRASTRRGAPVPRARQQPHTRGARRSPGPRGSPSRAAERERQLSSSRSAPPLRPAAARGWPARRRPPAARSSGRPNSRRPARGAAWPSRRPGS